MYCDYILQMGMYTVQKLVFLDQRATQRSAAQLVACGSGGWVSSTVVYIAVCVCVCVCVIRLIVDCCHINHMSVGSVLEH